MILDDKCIRRLTKKDVSYAPYNEKTGNYPYGYFIDGKLVGKIRVTYTKGDNFYGLSWFYVNKADRGNGIGKKLLDFVIHKYNDKKLLLNVDIHNDQAVTLYQRYGFKIVFTNHKPKKGNAFYVMERK